MRRIKVMIARWFSPPSAARVRASIRRDARAGFVSNWFYQGRVGH
jgi:hypothetical protein